MSFRDTHNTEVSPEVELHSCREAVECMDIIRARLLIVVVVKEEVWRLWNNDITPDFATHSSLSKT
jgi:hypothetical protein